MPVRGKPFDPSKGREYVDLFCPWCCRVVDEDETHLALEAAILVPSVVLARGPGERAIDDRDFMAPPFYVYRCSRKGCDYAEIQSHRLFVARPA